MRQLYLNHFIGNLNVFWLYFIEVDAAFNKGRGVGYKARLVKVANLAACLILLTTKYRLSFLQEAESSTNRDM
jgi:hypothetical protein